MDNWIGSAFLALLIYGFWGFFPKLAVNYIDPKSALVFEVLGAMVVGICVLGMVGFQPQSHPKGVLFAALTGVAGMLGTLFYFFAASHGKISVVVSMTALYPLVTICIAALVLHEPISVKQMFGMLAAIIAIVLFTT